MSAPPSRVAVIVNANAQRFVQKPSRIGDVERMVARGNERMVARGNERMVARRAKVFVTRSRVDLARAVEELEKEGVDVVVLCGGDGSYGAGATEICRVFSEDERPLVALAPGGTVGTVARGLGVAESASRVGLRDGLLVAIARVVDRACAPPSLRRVIETPSLLVEADDRPPSVGFIFGTGLVASFFRLYDARGADEDAPSVAVGKMGAAAIVARIFLESFYGGPYARQVLEPMRCDVDVDRDGTLERLPWPASSLVLTSVVRDLGLHMLVPHRAGEDPSRPHVVVSGLPPRVLGPRMIRVLRGVSIGNPGDPHFDDLARALVVSFPGDAPGPFVVDGDLRLARRVSVRAGPTLRILAPTPRAF